MNIGIIQQAPDIGGAEEYTRLLAKQFQQKGNKIYFATNNNKLALLLKPYTFKNYIIPLRLDIIGNLRGLLKSTLLLLFAIVFYIKLLMNFKKSGVDVILMSGFSEKMLVTFLSPFFGIPVVWIEFGPLKTIFVRNFYIPKFTYSVFSRIAKKIIVPTKNTGNDLAKYGFIPENRLVVIPCGIEIKAYAKKNKAVVKEWEKCFVIGNVSRLTREKGQDVLIRAFSRIVRVNPNARLLLVGQGPDEAYFSELVTRLGLDDKVKITGYVKDVSKYYDAMDMFVFPTVWTLEGFGLVLVEAMTHKIPIIASDFGPIPEIVDSKTGAMFKKGDEVDLADHINFLMNKKSEMSRLAENGYKKAKEKFDIKVVASEILGELVKAKNEN